MADRVDVRCLVALHAVVEASHVIGFLQVQAIITIIVETVDVEARI